VDGEGGLADAVCNFDAGGVGGEQFPSGGVDVFGGGEGGGKDGGAGMEDDGFEGVVVVDGVGEHAVGDCGASRAGRSSADDGSCFARGGSFDVVDDLFADGLARAIECDAE